MSKISKQTMIKVLKLIKASTRAEIIARHGDCKGLGFGDYFQEHIKLDNKIRELLYGSSDLVTLGLKWGLLKEKDRTKERINRGKCKKHQKRFH